MKIAFFVNDIYFRSRVLYRVLLENSEHEFYVFHVANSNSKKKNLESIREKFRFWGFKGFIILGTNTVFQKFISIFLKKPYYKNMSNIRKISNYFNADYVRVFNVNSKFTLEKLQSFSPDILISLQHQIMRSHILRIPKITAINCHSSLLPNYRGRKPIFWAMLNKETIIGLSVHTMTHKIDVGKLISQKELVINEKNKYIENTILINELSSHVISKAIVMLENNSLDKFPELDFNRNDYYSQPQKHDLKLFKKQGMKIS